MKALLPLSVVAFWGWMMLLLVQREVLPAFGQSAPMTYQTALQGISFPYEENFKLFFLRGQFGEMTTRYLKDDAGGYRIENHLDCKFNTDGVQKWARWFPAGWDAFLRMNLDWTISLDPRLRLRQVEAAADLPSSQKLSLKGTVNRELLHLTYSLGDGPPVERVFPYSHDMLLGHGLGGVGFLKPLAVGKVWKMQVLDLTSLAIQKRLQTKEITYFVKSRETIEWKGRQREAFVIDVGPRGIDGEITADPDGTVLRERHYGIEILRQ